MKKQLSNVFLTICAVVTLGIASFAATSQANMAVSANVSADCTISAAPLNFGTYNPASSNSSTGSDVAVTANLTVACANGSTGAITLGQGANADAGSSDLTPLRRMTDGGGNFLSYTLYQDTNHEILWGNDPESAAAYEGTGSSTPVTVFGNLGRGQNVPAGAYTDTVVATITF